MAEMQEYHLLMGSLDVSVSKHKLDEHFTVVWANDRYYQMFGYTKEEYEALYHNQCDLFYQNDPQDWARLSQIVLDTLQKGGKKYEHVGRIRHRDGRRLWIKLVGNFTDEYVDGCRISYTVMMDISSEMQAKVEQTIAYNNIPGFVAKYRIKAEGIELLNANEKFLSHFVHYDLLSLETLRQQLGKHTALQHASMRRGEPINFEFSVKNTLGRRTIMHVTGEAMDIIGGDPIYLFVFDDITELTQQKERLEQANSELERLAYYDTVTGAYNRTRFEMKAAEAISKAPGGTYTLVWLNLDKFKLVNEIAGSQGGDRLLRYIHDTVQPMLQKGEIFARIAADNFVMLLYSKGQNQLSERLDAMAKRINRFNASRKQKYYLTFTAGAYLITKPDVSITAISDRANVARRSIERAANVRLCTCKFYSEQDKNRLMREKDMENRMREALEQEEFEVYLQPKLSLESNKIAGAEALVRWNDPKRGLVPPNEFIPLFEKNGFIVRLDLYVFWKVCKLLRSWEERRLSQVPISVNLSRFHLLNEDFLKQYLNIRRKYGIAGGLLELELTETMVFENPRLFRSLICQIHKAGFSCSMDDFGSGYSSLNILKDLKVDVLKLDRGFCSSGQMEDPREKTVISSVVELAKKLQMKTVAEGVETQQQLEFLRETRCDMIQGYVFSRPLPVPSFEELMRRHNG